MDATVCGRRYYEELPHPGSSSPSFPIAAAAASPMKAAPSSPRHLQGGRRSWVVAVRRAVVRAVARVTRRRRRCISWAAAKLWGTLRRAVGTARPSGKKAAGYDSAGYARNFDDGGWRDEDDDFWSGGGPFAFRFSRSSRYVRDGGSAGLAPPRGSVGGWR